MRLILKWFQMIALKQIIDNSHKIFQNIENKKGRQI